MEDFADLPPGRTALREIPCDRASVWSFAGGLLATGSKNGRAYLQILLIPIPLWNTE